MLVYYREITVEWGESDPFGLVYFPRMLAWFNDAEHEFFAQAGYPVKQMVEQDRTAFVMGRVDFEFVGPAAYGEMIVTRLELIEHALGYEYEGLERTVDSHIKNLRRKIEPHPGKPIYIETIYGVGYRLQGEP